MLSWDKRSKCAAGYKWKLPTILYGDGGYFEQGRLWTILLLKSPGHFFNANNSLSRNAKLFDMPMEIWCIRIFILRMSRLTPGRTGSLPVSMSSLKMSVFSSWSSFKNALRSASSLMEDQGSWFSQLCTQNWYVNMWWGGRGLCNQNPANICLHNTATVQLFL